MEDEKTYQLIEDYLQGNLSGEAKISFEQNLINNPKLRAELQLHRQIHGELAQDVIELRRELKTITRKKGELKVKPGLRMFILRYGAVAAVLLIGIIYIPKLFFPMNENKVYNQFYESYPMAINMRSGETEYEINLNSAINAYLQEDFKQAIESFSKMDSMEIIHHFYWANAYLSDGQFENANAQFDVVIESEDPRLIQQAQWYKGLILIKEKKIDEAINYFDALDDEHYKKKEISQLLKQLQNLN